MIQTKIIFLIFLASHMENLSFNLTNFPREKAGVSCAISTKLLKVASVIDSSEYECFFCNENSIGSFVFIQNNIENRQLSICDVQVFGYKIKETGRY